MEVVVIVGSILLAFAIDAWWGTYQARREVHVALEQLQAEFLENRERLHSAEVSHRSYRIAFTEMLKIVRQKGDPPGSYVIADNVRTESQRALTFDGLRET